MCQQYQSSCLLEQYPLIVSQTISITHPCLCFSNEGNNSWRIVTDQQPNSVVVIVIQAGHSRYKQTTLSVDKYFNSHSKFIACPEAHEHCLSSLPTFWPRNKEPQVWFCTSNTLHMDDSQKLILLNRHNYCIVSLGGAKWEFLFLFFVLPSHCNCPWYKNASPRADFARLHWTTWLTLTRRLLCGTLETRWHLWRPTPCLAITPQEALRGGHTTLRRTPGRRKG